MSQRGHSIIKVILGLKGLKSECSQLAREVNINDVYWTWQSKESIKNAVKEVNIKEIKTELLKTRKVEDRWQEDCKKRDYLSYMNLREARVWIRFRSRMISGVKANKSLMHRNDMTCRCCEGDEAETKEHLEMCAGTENQQRGLENRDRWQTRVNFWRRLQKKVEGREADEVRRRKLEKEARKQNRCEAETQGAAADHQEVGTAGKPLDDPTETQVHGDDEGGVPPPGFLRNQIHFLDVIK